MLSACFRYVYEDVDRHGNVRIYFWRGKGHKKVRLRAVVGSADFAADYEAALAQSSADPELTSHNSLDPPQTGTWRWLCVEYFGSEEFRWLDPRTQRVRRRILEGTYEEKIAPDSMRVFAEAPIAELTPLAMRVLRDRKARAPEAANSRLKAARQVFSWAKTMNLKGVSSNPAREVPYLKRSGTGWHSWSIEEIEQYERRHPVGTRARLALALFMYTGQRRSDVVRLGRQHARDGWLNSMGVDQSRQPLSRPMRTALSPPSNPVVPTRCSVWPGSR
jgi:hypothetical protein